MPRTQARDRVSRTPQPGVGVAVAEPRVRQRGVFRRLDLLGAVQLQRARGSCRCCLLHRSRLRRLRGTRGARRPHVRRLDTGLRRSSFAGHSRLLRNLQRAVLGEHAERQFGRTTSRGCLQPSSLHGLRPTCRIAPGDGGRACGTRRIPVLHPPPPASARAPARRGGGDPRAPLPGIGFDRLLGDWLDRARDRRAVPRGRNLRSSWTPRERPGRRRLPSPRDRVLHGQHPPVSDRSSVRPPVRISLPAWGRDVAAVARGLDRGRGRCALRTPVREGPPAAQ